MNENIKNNIENFFNSININKFGNTLDIRVYRGRGREEPIIVEIQTENSTTVTFRYLMEFFKMSKNPTSEQLRNNFIEIIRNNDANARYCLGMGGNIEREG